MPEVIGLNIGMTIIYKKKKNVRAFNMLMNDHNGAVLGAATSKLDMVFETKLAAEFCLITNVIFESDCCRLQVS